MQSVRLAVIDGLRGLAIGAVIFSHAYLTGVANYLHEFGIRPYIIDCSWMGVGLFFVLSGFVLALPFAEGRYSFASLRDLLAFYRHRALRLFPLFILVATFAYLIILHREPNANPKRLFLVLSTVNMFNKHEYLPTIYPALWSLVVEIWFSILFPLVMISAVRFRMERVLPIILVVCFLVRLRFCAHTTLPYLGFWKDRIFGRLDDFAIGIAIAMMYAKGHLPRWNSGLTFLSGCIFIILSALIWNEISLGNLGDLAKVPANNITQIGFGLMLIAALISRNSIRSILSFTPLRISGLMCYSLYVWHPTLVTPELVANPLSIDEEAKFWGFLLVMSFASFRFVENYGKPWARVRSALFPSKDKNQSWTSTQENTSFARATKAEASPS